MVAIFHASDLTQAGAMAFLHALRLAVGEGNKLTIMHVHGKGERAKGWDNYPRVRETLDRWGLTANHATAGISVRKVEAEGDSVSGALVNHLNRHATDLIVLASEGRDGLSGMFKQSIAHRVVRRARVPALVLPNRCPGFVGVNGELNLRHVMVAVAPNPDPQVAVDAATWLVNLAGVTPSRFSVVHAGPRPVTVALPPFPGAESVAVTGTPLETVLRTASQQDADLIVLTTEGRKGFAENFTGSFTEQVSARADCPVLILPAPDYKTASAV